MIRRSLLFLSLWVATCCTIVVSALAPPLQPSRRDFFQATAAAAATAASVMAVVGAATNPANAAYETPATGAKAPAFELPNSRGEGDISLTNLIANKKWTVLYFYPGAFTQGTVCCMIVAQVESRVESFSYNMWSSLADP